MDEKQMWEKASIKDIASNLNKIEWIGRFNARWEILFPNDLSTVFNDE